jgi:GT2 family glycosyltransferase
VALVVVNWNSSSDTQHVVGAILDEYPDIKVVVVDNGSSKDDWDALAALDSRRVVLERLPENRGYAAGVNRGIELARAQGLTWAWLMNPDALPYPSCLVELLDFADGAALLSPQQLSSSIPFESCAVPYVSAVRRVRSRLRHESCTGCSTGHHDVDIVTGTGLLVNVELALEVGLMNEDFFHYKEEFEFAERLSDVGTIRFVCRARLWHARGGSLSNASPIAEYYRVRNELVYLSLRLGRWWRVKPRTIRWALRSIFRASQAQPEMRRAILAGVGHGLAGRVGRYGS